jgi:hypothetical protein
VSVLGLAPRGAADGSIIGRDTVAYVRPWLQNALPRDEVLTVAETQGAHSYDAPGARCTHRDGKCSFDVLVEDFDLAGHPALVRLAQIVHAADVSEDRDTSPEGPGLYAIAHGFALLHGTADHKKIDLEGPMYDALYAWCQEQAR